MGGESTVAVSWVFKAGVWILSMVTAGLIAYGAARSDIAVLQSKQLNTDNKIDALKSDHDHRLERMENKIDLLLQRQP